MFPMIITKHICMDIHSFIHPAIHPSIHSFIHSRNVFEHQPYTRCCYEVWETQKWNDMLPVLLEGYFRWKRVMQTNGEVQ